MLTDAEKAEIRRLRQEGMTFAAIAERFGCLYGRTWQIAHNVERPVRISDSHEKHDGEQEIRKALRKLKRKLRYIQARQKAGRVKPCERCRWRMNKAPRPVCVVCYREVLR